MDLYYLVVFFIFGLIFGSFFNVVGYRLPKKMSLISPSSHCPKCKHKLTPLELVPVLSWIFQKGKCKECKKNIPIFYPIFELFTGIIFALIYHIFGLSINTFIALVFASMILILIISDLLYMIIPDELLILCGLIIFILKIILNGFKRESLGGGDIKLMLVFGMVLGWAVSLFTVVLSSFLALPISLINIKNNKSHEIPLGPYLGISALICLIAKIDASVLINFLGF